MRTATFALSLAIALVTLGASTVRADALTGVPTCAPGFFGVPPTRHHEDTCRPWRCHADSDCTPRPGVSYAAECRASGLCTIGGHATNTCEAPGRACSGTDPSVVGGTCVAARLCMPRPSPPLPPGGAESRAPTNLGGALALSMLVVGVVRSQMKRRTASR